MTSRSIDRTSDDGTAPPGAPATGTIERRDPRATRAGILEAARRRLLNEGYARMSTRRVAEMAGVPLSQIHYHFGSKQQLILAVLADQNARLLERQQHLYSGPEPLWEQWTRACDYLEEDVESGYVRILQEMIAAGWSEPELAGSVRELLAGWYELLTGVAQREAVRVGGLGPFTPREVAALMALPFLGAEAMILLGFSESELPTRSALRKIGELIRGLETATPGTDGSARPSTRRRTTTKRRSP
jgi:AcrR family transcriptional regulator